MKTPPQPLDSLIKFPWPAWAATVFLLLLLAAISARADWPDNNHNVAKWIEGPDRSINGFDVLAAPQPPGPANNPPLILADDFRCTQSGPITDIHIWASWFGIAGTANIPPIPITLSFWSDVPAITNNPTGPPIPSHPGQMLWTQTFVPGQYVVRPWSSSNERFWDPDPSPNGIILGPDNLIWQYNFYPTNPFVQQGSAAAPVIYWLSVTAGSASQTGAPGPLFGWKTSTNQVLDNAVFGHLNAAGTPAGDWQELIAPNSAPARSLDMSFVLTTPEIVTNPPPPNNKWVQYPNMINGYDVDATLPFIAADDFVCTNASTITNIQVWGSWINNNPDSNTTFVVSIWSDVPAIGNRPSHPGNLEWTETFGPGQYNSTFVGQGQEQFY